MTVTTTCPKCETDDITELNPELKKTEPAETVQIKCRCNKCGFEFESTEATDWDHDIGILY